MDTKDLEKMLIPSPKKVTEKEIMGEVGAFGAVMAVIGLGVEVLHKRPGPVGKDLMRLGVLVGAVGYGVRWMS